MDYSPPPLPSTPPQSTDIRTSSLANGVCSVATSVASNDTPDVGNVGVGNVGLGV